MVVIVIVVEKNRRDGDVNGVANIVVVTLVLSLQLSQE